MNKVNPIPAGYHTLTPYLIVKGAAKAIEFYKKALGAEELFRMDMGGGMIGHAELMLGTSRIMLADEYPDMGAVGPHTVGGSPVSLMMYVKDVDAVAATAVKEGMKVIRPIANQFYGDRSGSFEDPFGHKWNISTHVEDVSPEEMDRRMAQMSKT